MNGERDSLRPDDQAPKEEAPQTEEAGALPPQGVVSQSNRRRALRRLQSGPPSSFEQVVDLLYEWKVHVSDAQITDMMRKLLQSNHNMSDANAIKAMTGFIKEARFAKVNAAIARMGLDEAESVLGLKSDPEEEA
jgi:hypothetical protein